MNTTLQKDILTETFQDYRGLVINTAKKFWNVYGGELDEWIAEANLHFIHAVEVFDETRSKLSTWISYHIFKELQKTFFNRKNPETSIEDFEGLDREAKAVIPFIDTWDELNSDCKILCKCLLETPKEIFHTLKRDKTQATIFNTSNHYLWKCLKSKSSKWTRIYIRDTFLEIIDVLKN